MARTDGELDLRLPPARGSKCSRSGGSGGAQRRAGQVLPQHPGPLVCGRLEEKSCKKGTLALGLKGYKGTK
jgi:hypothetical protein